MLATCTVALWKGQDWNQSHMRPHMPFLFLHLMAGTYPYTQ